MKRSVINSFLREAKDFIKKMNFALPPFAFWSPEEWKTKGSEYNEIRDNQLGWDITDFGSGDYEKTGLLLFTIRNGSVKNPSGKPYAEKLLILKPGQVVPFHYHKSKMEDIINRGGGTPSEASRGTLKIQVYRSLNACEGQADAETIDEKAAVPLSIDGRNFTAEAGTIISLENGESITLFQNVFHKFWTEDSMLLLGEVSMVNDDHNDNFFLEKRGRFPVIEEDEKPLHLLVGDY